LKQLTYYKKRVLSCVIYLDIFFCYFRRTNFYYSFKNSNYLKFHTYKIFYKMARTNFGSWRQSRHDVWAKPTSWRAGFARITLLTIYHKTNLVLLRTPIKFEARNNILKCLFFSSILRSSFFSNQV
jgi:hypothetical protein